MRFCDLQQKEVINVNDCKCFGTVSDISFDEKKGCIECLIIPGPGKVLGCFCREFEWWIPWCKILCIGTDIILVDVDEKEIRKKN